MTCPTNDSTDIFILLKIAKALQAFRNRNKAHMRLNLTKLFSLLKVSPADRTKYIRLIFEFQELFRYCIPGYVFEKSSNDGDLCLKLRAYKDATSSEGSLERGDDITTYNSDNTVLKISKEDILLLNDIIYIFQHVRRGKGFDPLGSRSKLERTVRRFYGDYPPLIMVGEDGSLYPSRLGLELGGKIHAYLKTNRLPSEISVRGWRIIIGSV